MPDAEGGCYRISRQEDTYRVGQCPVPEMRTGHFGKLRVKYYSDFKSFKDAIDSIIDGTDNIFKDQVAKLIGEKIQLYDNLVPVCENTFSAKNQEIKQAASR